MSPRLDHLGFLVPDLQVTSSLLEEAGFALTAPVRLTDGGGRWTGGVQRTSVFPEGYLEIQQLEALGLGHPLESRAGRVPAAVVIAWASDDMDGDVAAARRAGRPASDAQEWSRATPGGLARFRFSILGGGDPAAPLVILTQHLTPDLVRGADTPQPNGVVALRSVVASGPGAALLELHGRGDHGRSDRSVQPWRVDRVRLGARDPAALVGRWPQLDWPLIGQDDGVATFDVVADLGVLLEVEPA